MTKKLIILFISLGLLITFLEGSALAKKKKNPKHLKDLKCAVNEIAKFNGIKWKCSLDEDTGDTLGDLSCDTSQIAEYDGNEWVCADKGDSGSPAGLPFILKDANGQQVGTITTSQRGVIPGTLPAVNSIIASTRVTISTPNGEKSILLRVTQNQILGPGRIFFSDPDCQGNAFIQLVNNSNETILEVFPPAFNNRYVIAKLGDERLLYFTTDETPVQTPFQSQAAKDDANNDCFTAGGSDPLVPAFEGDPDLHTTFPPLFTLEAQ